MRKKNFFVVAIVVYAAAFLGVGAANAQWGSPNAYGYNTGYGAVYGSFGLASTIQSMYNVARAQSSQKQNGAAKSTNSSSSVGTVPSAPIVRNYGLFRPDATVDTGAALAAALGSTPEEKNLIKQIYGASRKSYDEEAASRGWKNNIAAGLTFFTVAAMTTYHDSEQPSEDAINSYYKIMNAALDEMPEMAKAPNRDKQGFNNTLVGFGGILFTGYSEAKQSNDPKALASYKKLAGMLIEMVLKTDPEKVRVENGQIVLN